MEKFSSIAGCSSNYTGILEAWNNIDNYLIAVDSKLCSLDCPCSITNVTGYLENSTALGNYVLWNKLGTNTAFQNCSAVVQAEAASAYTGSSVNATSLNTANFATYWALLENKFNCSGWCQTEYSSTLGVKMQMYKYMFTDVNRYFIFLLNY